MTNKLDVSGLHGSESEQTLKYITKRLTKLERYLPQHARKSAHFHIIFREHIPRRDHAYGAECIVQLPGTTMRAFNHGLDNYNAFDLMEEKLKAQLMKYKDVHAVPRQRRHLLHRLKLPPEQANA